MRLPAFQLRVHRIAATGAALIVVLLSAACNPADLRPTPVTKPTLAPDATVGPLTQISVDSFGLSLIAPSTWAAPALIDGGFILSPDGSTDTSNAAGAFVYVIPDAATTLPKRITFVFRPEISDPTVQLDYLVTAINIDAYRFPRAVKYNGAKYPAAIVTGFGRDNQLKIVLMSAGNNRWIYVGVQSPERYFKYFDSAVFTPAINSITVK